MFSVIPKCTGVFNLVFIFGNDLNKWKKWT